MSSGLFWVPLPGQPLRAEFGPGEPADELAQAGQIQPAGRISQFIGGAENQLAQIALRGLLADPASGYSPLVFYGPSGIGKTHLALGAAQAWKNNWPDSSVWVTTGADFLRQASRPRQPVVDVTSEGKSRKQPEQEVDPRDAYGRAALLVVENIDALADHPAAQQQLLGVLDAAGRDGRRVVITALDNPARQIHFATALRSRLAGGLSIRLVKPAAETRTQIVRELATVHAIALSPAACRLLADGLNGTVPELLGALTQLEITAKAAGDTIDCARVRQYLAHRESGRQPTLQQIASLTAKHFSESLAQMKSPSRRKGVVAARAAAMYLARELTSHSLKRIGAFFGGRDHTTVLHNCQTTQSRIENDAATRGTILEIRGLISQ